MIWISGLWIDKVGIEVECAIDKNLQNRRKEVARFRREYDSSITTEKPQAESKEYVSDPVDYPEEIEDLETSVRTLYGKIREINASMGLHIHVSMNKDKHYYRLTSLKFHDYFIDRVRDSDLWSKCPRLRKRVKNRDSHPFSRSATYGHYCKPIKDNYTIDKQLDSHSGKYRRINYMKHKYDTVEFRLFPAMESPSKVMEAVDLVTTSINAYLREGLYSDSIGTELTKNDAVGSPRPEKTISIESSVDKKVNHDV
ncbi:amidoligase family protein [Haloarcula litorea]|uniref:amidoligase family protein n=1 Tax=Haloarcula litorea TaxID=3032579 RepID=UPI0023E82F9E|nr:amidoligase family protein [Halomicroarcula sp. GDY20]